MRIHIEYISNSEDANPHILCVYKVDSMNMRTICVLLVTVLCWSITFTESVEGNQSNNVDKELILKQKDLLRLFKHVLQTSYYEDQAEIAKNYSLEDNLNNSTNETAATKFIKLHKIGLLRRGAVFSIFNDKHRQQAVALFDVLYYAKGWDNFYKIACWTREYVNEAMFVYAMHVAVMHRADTKDLVLPPIYEIYPHFFVNKAVIDKANDYKIYHGIDENTTYHQDDHHANSYLKYILKEQNDLAYFHDDVRLNANYYYFHIAYPFWMDSNKYGLQMDIRGELFYFLHQQILARYYLERLTEGHGTIDVYNWQSPIKTGYSSKLGYPNGVNFPSRPADTNLIYNQQSGFDSRHNHFFQIQDIEDYESRIRTAIDFGHILTLNVSRESIYQSNSFNVLANLVECNADSKNTRYFGPLQTLARQVLGYTFSSNNNITKASALEHFETSLRDPMFYQFYNRIIHYLVKYKNNLPEYNQTELKCSGVTINNVTISTLNTFFEKFEFEISNALYTDEDEKKDGFQAWAHQYRLNHDPFTYTINVTSDTVTNVAVRVFIGPKYDNEENEIPFNENRLNFVEFDKFEHSLEKGKNIIIRNSTQGKSAQDRINFRTLYQDVSDGLKDNGTFKHNMPDLHKNFVLPKGESNGRVYKFFIHISSQIRTDSTSSGCNIDGRSFGYPLDRQISDEISFFVPNSYLFEQKVYYNRTHVN